MHRLQEFIEKVRSNNENTLHQSCDIDHRWEEKGALNLPEYDIQKNEEFLKLGIRNKKTTNKLVALPESAVKPSEKLIFEEPKARPNKSPEPVKKKLSSLKIEEEIRND